MKYTKIINYVVYGTLGTLFFFTSSAILFYKKEDRSRVAYKDLDGMKSSILLPSVAYTIHETCLNCKERYRNIGPYYSAAKIHNDGRLVPTGSIRSIVIDNGRSISTYGRTSTTLYDKCVDVTNNAGNTIYIPTKTSAEFNSFLNNPPSKVSVDETCRPRMEAYVICPRVQHD